VQATVQLLDRTLADPVMGAVRETFAEDWKFNQPVRQNLVEAVHQVEWAWLLRAWQPICIASRRPCGRLVAHAMAYGIDRERGLVRNIVRKNESIVKRCRAVLAAD
jgi:mannose/cellobiose epimerase-like protein (N-acyl-D-glucosamine 2-epimerase family)